MPFWRRLFQNLLIPSNDIYDLRDFKLIKQEHVLDEFPTCFDLNLVSTGDIIDAKLLVLVRFVMILAEVDKILKLAD